MRGLLLGAIVLLCAPGVAQAADTAYVNASGVVVVQGDGSTNQINFAEGANANGYSYGAAVWDAAPGESVTPGSGCTLTNDPEWNGTPGVVECGSFGGTAIVVDEGNGAGDTITNNAGKFWNDGFCNTCDGYFTSITITAGSGGDTIEPVRDNDKPSSTVTVNGGSGNDTITIGSDTTNAATVTLNGGAGNDTITGPNGCTCTVKIDGGAGNNSIAAGDGSNVAVTVGPGNNSITAGQGNDTINTFNGHRDQVTCKILGSDDVTADQYDVVNKIDCAKVTVKQWGTPPPKPTVSLLLPAHQHPVRSRKILATVRCSAACYMGAVGQVRIGRAKPFQLASDLFHLIRAGSETITLPLSAHQLKLIKAALKAHKRIVATIIAVLTDASGQRLEGRSGGRTLAIRS